MVSFRLNDEEKWKGKWLSHVRLCDPMHYTIHGILQARILEWVDVPFSRGSSEPRDRTQVSHIAGRFFTSWDTREAQMMSIYLNIFNPHILHLELILIIDIISNQFFICLFPSVVNAYIFIISLVENRRAF